MAQQIQVSIGLGTARTVAEFCAQVIDRGVTFTPDERVAFNRLAMLVGGPVHGNPLKAALDRSHDVRAPESESTKVEKPRIIVFVDEGVVSRVVANIGPGIEVDVADCDVFDDCAGGLDGKCEPEVEADRKEEHDRVRKLVAEASTLEYDLL